VRYADAIAKLFALESRGIRMGVSRMSDALAYRGRPDRGQRFVLVAGTNGKGSVATMIASCLRRAGYRTGLFTSPHLHRYVERFRIDGRPLAEREASRRIEDLLSCFSQPDAPETTFFELTTLLGIEAFRDHECQVAVLEVGLGGRLDATNAVDPALTVITRIALDHTRVLGDTLGKIAAEKAGILRPGVPLVSGVLAPAARRVVTRRARALGSPIIQFGQDVTLEPRARGRFDLMLAGRRIEGLRSALAGRHQQDNAALAVAAVGALAGQGLVVDDRAVRDGLARSRWPGRLEYMRGRPSFVFDAAHNVDGAEALVRYLEQEDPWRTGAGRRVLVFSAMADKRYPQMLAALAPSFDRIIYCAPPIRRAAEPRLLSRAQPGRVARSVADAIARARRAAGEGGEVVVAGSIFLVADARALVTGARTDPLIRM